MDVRTYRARSIQEALRLIREDLGPDAAVLHTREVSAGMLGLFGARQIEVTASNEVNVPSRLPEPVAVAEADYEEETYEEEIYEEPAPIAASHNEFRNRVREQLRVADRGTSVVDEMVTQERTTQRLPTAFSRSFARL